MNKTVYRILLMTLLLVLIFIADILLGSVTIPLSDFFEYLKGNNWSHPSYEAIIFEYRLPKALTACFAGSALAVSGLLMQSF